MGFKEAVRSVLVDKYVTFSGRAARSEYWWCTLFIFIVYMVLFLLFLVTGGMRGMETGQMSGAAYLPLALLGIFAIGIILPAISVVVRRFHDRNMSGWWYLGAILAGMIPFVGILASIAVFVLMVLKGTDGPNRFGPDPLALHGGSDVFE